MSNNQFPKDVSIKQPPMNNFSMNYPILPSMMPSNQLSIMCATAGPPAIPNPKAPQVLTRQVPSTATQLAPMLAAELQGNTIDASNKFLGLLFPANCAPFQINDKTFKALAQEQLFHTRRNTFTAPTDFKEETVASWLNTIGNVLSTSSSIPVKHCWWHGTNMLPPISSPFHVKPDLILIDYSYHEALSDKKNADPHISWLRVPSFAELTALSCVPQWMPTTINAKSYVLLTYQFNHCFALALSLK
ncbi:hypothetical protein L208DRAFT_1382639 [Tricholoma matsutake]|nr:hypothetical protein L208DRAFT_1382639 [Tricholoma matsutake 945]